MRKPGPVVQRCSNYTYFGLGSLNSFEHQYSIGKVLQEWNLSHRVQGELCQDRHPHQKECKSHRLSFRVRPGKINTRSWILFYWKMYNLKEHRFWIYTWSVIVVCERVYKSLLTNQTNQNTDTVSTGTYGGEHELVIHSIRKNEYIFFWGSREKNGYGDHPHH